MKIVIITFALMLSSMMLQADRVKLITCQDEVISAQLLFGTDSLLYFWTGGAELNADSLHYIDKIGLKELKTIDLTDPLYWGEGIGKVLPYTLVPGLLVGIKLSQASFLSASIGIVSFFLINIVVALPAGALVAAASNIPRKINDPASRDFIFLQKKLKKYFLLKETERELINNIIFELDRIEKSDVILSGLKQDFQDDLSNLNP